MCVCVRARICAHTHTKKSYTFTKYMSTTYLFLCMHVQIVPVLYILKKETFSKRSHKTFINVWFFSTQQININLASWSNEVSMKISAENTIWKTQVQRNPKLYYFLIQIKGPEYILNADVLVQLSVLWSSLRKDDLFNAHTMCSVNEFFKKKELYIWQSNFWMNFCAKTQVVSRDYLLLLYIIQYQKAPMLLHFFKNNVRKSYF